MSADQEEYQAYAVHLSAEHRRIFQCILHIEEQLRLVQAEPHAALVDVTKSLTQLRTELSKHFAEEESGGCLEEAVLHHPDLMADAARVLNEHPSFLADIDRLIEQIEASRGSKLSLDTIDERFRKFAQRLRVHEAAENRILQESFGIDGA